MYLLISMDNIKQETNRTFLFFIAITAALGGFLFGYDTAVISGTTDFTGDFVGLIGICHGARETGNRTDT